ncbi:DNA-binding transcriptional regulator, LysR family [Izhakiella capsodis]|uniref:DNA-binding transcriptional regulator, LysR family n=1 Tax=Izhakiella capsodis TaxID=1367852 RepID=A0A1I4W0L4_9GAMM|nr:LysR family transcriptional regulator [Izhakiella capsodis]SFN06689.1 DNA-binding transcriptional regulator, LysR family [Izhakiella capsodis]
MDRDNNRGMRDWLIFIRTAETGSLSETARQLDISTAAVSKAIIRIERYLGTVLFTRTTQGMSLTESGMTTLHRARDIAASFNALLEEIRNPEGEIKGSVRFTAPAIVCEFLASEWCYEYMQAHPGVRIFLDARERPDLRFDSPELDDVVLRSGRIESDNLVHRKLSPVKLCLCASQRYLDRHPPIIHPRDLAQHALFGMHQNGLAGPLRLSRGEESYLLEQSSVSGLSSNNLLAMLNLVMQGKGISIATPNWLVAQHLSGGHMVKVLPEWQVPDLPVWLIWKQQPRQQALFTHFRDYIERCWNNRPRYD